jgi:hypothetical protein
MKELACVLHRLCPVLLVCLVAYGCAGANNSDPTPGWDGAAPGADAAPGALPPSATSGDAGPLSSPDAAVVINPTGPGDDNKCGAVTQMAENKLQPVDIIFGIDTSGSMAEEVAQVQQNLNAFSQKISSSGIDVRVIMLATFAGKAATSGGAAVDGPCVAAPLGSGQCPNDSNPPAYVHLPEEVTSWDVLDVYIKSYPKYAPHLRENSLKTFVSISDDDADPSNSTFAIVAQLGGLFPMYHSADAFIAAVEKLAPGTPMWSHWRYSGIFVIEQCTDGALGGKGIVHNDLVKRTGGVAGDICSKEFKPVFDELAKQVAAAVVLACDWEIPPSQNGPFDKAKTNVRLSLDGAGEQLFKVPDASKCGAPGGWHYNDEDQPSKVVACPATCKRIQSTRNAQVDLQFGCQTQVLL